MALQKQQISVDFVKGTDTKTNDIMSENFKDMQNVVFTNDLTVKKMPGYDNVATLPESTDQSLFFKRNNDILAMTSSGTYKFNNVTNAFAKISDLRSSELNDSEAYGHFFVSGTNYNAYLKSALGSSTSSIAINSTTQKMIYTITFTDKQGVVINSITYNSGSPDAAADDWYWDKYSKGVAIGDTFYFTYMVSATVLGLFKFKLTGSTFAFDSVYQFTDTPIIVGPPSILAFDMFSDGTNIFASFNRGGTNRRYYKFEPTFLAPLILNTAESWFSLELHDFDATYFLGAAAICSVSTASVKLLKIRKSDLVTVLTTTIDSIANSIITTTSELQVLAYPLSDTTTRWFAFVTYSIPQSSTSPAIVAPGQIKTAFCITDNDNYYDGVLPLSKMFLYNGKYYSQAMIFSGLQRNFIIMEVGVNELIPVASFNKSSVIGQSNYLYGSRKLSSTNAVGVYRYPGTYAIQETYSISGLYYFGSFADGAGSNLAALNFSTLKNMALDIAGKTIISGSLPMSYDGANMTEFGFLAEPYLEYVSTAAAGGLPASTYEIVCFYEWIDINGNKFRSGLSNTVGQQGSGRLTVAANSKINLSVFTPLISQKQNITINVYIKNSSMTNFQLSTKIDYQVSFGSAGTPFTISILPDVSAENLYTETGVESIAPSSMTAIEIYSDRVWYIKNTDNSNIFFSQKAVPGLGIEFNEFEGLSLLALDKRGMYEEPFTGLHAMDGRLFVFKQNSILYTVGDGPARDGSNSDLISPQLVTTDCGCISARSIVLMPEGLMFMSDKGIYLLNRKLQPSYIGAPVERFNSEIITSAILLESKNEVRFSAVSGIVLIYNYFTSQWSWSIGLPSSSALMTQGKYSILGTGGVWQRENLTHFKLNGTAIVQKISSPWLRANGEQAWQKIFDLLLVGKYKTEHQVKVSLYYDYEQYAEAVYTLDPLTSSQYNVIVRPSNTSIESGAAFDGVYQLLIDLPRKSCQAFRFEIEDIPLNTGANSGECFALTSFSITFGVKNGPAKIPTAKTY